MEKKKISSRIVVLLLVFMMLFTMMPTMAWADESEGVDQVEKVNVYLTSQADGGFLHAPKSVEVRADLAESYGFTGDLENGVSALDVLIKAHQEVFDEEFTPDNKDNYINGSASWISSAFGGIENLSFAVNGGCPNDGVWNDTYNAYTGYAINQTKVNEGDEVEFFTYQDEYWSDNYGLLSLSSAGNIYPNQSIVLNVKGYSYMYFGCSKKEDIENATKPVEKAQIAIVNAETGEVTNIEGAITDEDGNVNLSFPSEGEYLLTAYMPKEDIADGKTPLIMRLIKVTVKPLPDASITVPQDAEVTLSRKGKDQVNNYLSYDYIDNSDPIYNDDGTKTYYFDGLEKNKKYYYRVSGEEYVTYANFFEYKGEETKLKITVDMLNLAGKSKKDIDHDTTSNERHNVADVYLNINEKGYLNLNQGEQYQIINIRNWQIIDGFMNNNFVEPDYNYTILNLDGSIDSSDSILSIDKQGLLSAKEKGTRIVLVTYDAITVPFASGGPFFGAIWPENTGVFVVSIGEGDCNIDTNMIINPGENEESSKLAGNNIDSEMDVIYFFGDRGEYTFKPLTEGCKVSVANPTVTDILSFNGFTNVAQNDDLSFTVPLTNGRNIVKVEKDGHSTYQVITAKNLSYTINGGEDVQPGDKIEIVFNTVYNPGNKLAKIYNGTSGITYRAPSGELVGNIVGGTNGIYTIAADYQTVTNYIVKVKGSNKWGPTLTFQKGDELKIPEDYNSDTYVLSSGRVAAVQNQYCCEFGKHREIRRDTGAPTANTSSIRDAVFGQLPDIEIPVVIKDANLTSIATSGANVKKEYYEGDSFDATGLIVTASYDNGKSQIATNYKITPETLSTDTTEVTIEYRGKTATIPVTVNERKVEGLEVSKAPTKTVYTVGEVFNPTGIEITATYEGGVTKDVTENVTYSDTVFNVAGDDVKVTVSYTEKGITKTTTQSVKVNGASSIVPEDNITVSFTLLGDDEHGEPTEATGTHTLKNHNLKTWIPKTNVSVPKGSKVIDVIEKALGTAGIPFTNPGGNYIDTIRGLGEFSNGNLSGWMYTLNGVHPNLGVAEQTVKNGDVIVLHYTDDYTAEQGSESWGTPAVTESQVTTTGTSGSATTTTPTEVTVSGTTATATVKSENAAEAIKQAKENKSAEIVLNVTASDTKGAETVKIQLDTATVKSVVSDTYAVLTVKTENGRVSLDREALTTVVSEAKETTITLEVIKVINPTEVQKKAAGTNGQVLQLVVKSGDKIISDFNKGKATVTVEIPTKLQDKKVAVIHIADDGKIEQLSGKTVKIGGKDYYTFETPHFSTFALVDAEELGLEVNDEEANIVKIKELISDMSLKARSSKTSKKNIKVTLTVDKSTAAAIKEIKNMGYTVEYKYYRSTKKASKYQAKITKTTKTFTNTAGKKGTRYYYKARIQVCDKDGKLVAQTALKQCKYAVRTWTK